MPAPDEERFDVVVVGSGFGGAVPAYRLAEKGRCVLVLERGQPYPPGSFPRTPRQMREAFWDPRTGKHGLYEYWRFKGGLDVMCASGLGGGSLIYANVMLRKDPATFVQEDLADGGRESWPISREELEPHYERVLDMQQPQVYPATEPYASTPKTQAFEEAARAIGLEASHPPLAVLFAPAEGEVPVPGAPVAPGDLHGRPRTTCRLCGECDVGCNYGAKNTLDFTYLSAAKDEGAQIRTCCEARTIEPLGEGGYRIGYDQHLSARDGHRSDLLDPVEAEKRTVLADRVILAAGAAGSTRLLLLNGNALPLISPRLGTRVSANGDAIAMLRDARRRGAGGKVEPRYLDPSFGPVITTTIDVPEDKSSSGRGYRIQDAGAPVLADWLWESLELPKLPWRMRRAIVRAIGAKLLNRRRKTNLSGDLAQVFTDRSGRLVPLLANGRDVPDGRYSLDGDRLDLDWSSAPSEGYYQAVEETFREISDALDGKLRMSPWKWVNRSVTIHPLGGCPMAVNRRYGVVDPWGQVFGYAGLYVTDGSAMPGPVGANPSFTIAAFADRVAEAILENRPGSP
ncbi:MAG: GMC family oxidoreductase [Thermoleophilaceae bacterium]